MLVSFCLFVFAAVPLTLKETWYWEGSNVTDMVMSGVKCSGTEMSLSQCQHHKTVSCQKSAAKFGAGVICSESEWQQRLRETFQLLKTEKYYYYCNHCGGGGLRPR